MDDLYNFSKEKSWKEAIGFYVVTFVAAVCIVFVIGYIGGLMVAVSGNEINLDMFMVIGNIIAVIIAIVLFGMIARAKDRTSDPIFIVCGCVTLVLSALGGLLFGLLPLAWLTTRTGKVGVPSVPSEAQSEQCEEE